MHLLPTKRLQGEFPGATKNITEEKEYLPEHVFNAGKSSVLKNKCHKVHILVRKRSKDQDLRQEAIG